MAPPACPIRTIARILALAALLAVPWALEGLRRVGAGAPAARVALLGAEPDWVGAPGRDNARYGWSVAGAGDTDGDGYDDVLVGAPYFEADGGPAGAGRAFLYFGSPTGPSTEPAWTFDGASPQAHLGWSVSGAGDTNGDGYDDVLVGAPGTATGLGVVHLFYGGPDGPGEAPDLTLDIALPGASFGHAVAGLGDVNGDGYDDVAVGAPRHYTGTLSDAAGAVFIYDGSPEGLHAQPDRVLLGGGWQSSFGESVGAAGDVNGDGYRDVIVGAPYASASPQAEEGKAYVFAGSEAGVALQPLWERAGDVPNAHLGRRVAGAGDTDGDGYDDVLVSSALRGGRAGDGFALLYPGGPQGPADAPSWVGSLDLPHADYASDLAGLGDANGDGYGDVVVGARLYYEGAPADAAGAAFGYAGSSAGPDGELSWRGVGGWQSGTGAAVAGAGDVNGDGLADAVVGSPYDGGPSEEGWARVYHGRSPADTVPPAAVEDLTAAPGEEEGSLALAWTASGDDGTDGTAARYIVRYSTQPITEENWPSRLEAEGVPAPAPAGTGQSMTVRGLVPGQEYQVALRAEDDAGNVSPLSNVASATAAVDAVPPSAVVDLVAETGDEPGSVELRWTAPGDDGDGGIAAAYTVRYSLDPITPDTWGSATDVTGEPAPAQPGTEQTMVVGGLEPGRLHHFALVAEDAAGNVSPLSNDASAVAGRASGGGPTGAGLYLPIVHRAP